MAEPLSEAELEELWTVAPRFEKVINRVDGVTVNVARLLATVAHLRELIASAATMLDRWLTPEKDMDGSSMDRIGVNIYYDTDDLLSTLRAELADDRQGGK